MRDEVQEFVVRTRRRNALRVGIVGVIVLLVSLYAFGNPSTWLKTEYTYVSIEEDGQEVEVVEEVEPDFRVPSLVGIAVGVSLIFGGLVMFVRSKRVVAYAEDDDDLDDAVADSVAKMMPEDAPKKKMVDEEVLRKGLRRVGLRGSPRKK